MKVFAALFVLLTFFLLRADSTDRSGRAANSRQEICLSSAEYGRCHGHEQMWTYNAFRRRCERFDYSNCGGNGNRFFTERECLGFCLPNKDTKKRITGDAVGDFFFAKYANQEDTIPTN